MKYTRVYRGKRLIYLELMSQGKSPTDLNEAIKLLEEHGYRVNRPPVVRIQKNFEIDEGLWARVNAVREANKLLIRDCVHEALERWLSWKEQSSGDGQT